jgi:signal-transduction protein with cAMP-binding, CBS, and nucleotidyltransferase domain
MAQTVKDVMTSNPQMLDAGSSVQDAARLMNDHDIGDVIVLDGDALCGIVTDRDITVRAVADGKDPKQTKVGEICTKDVTTVAPSDAVDHAIQVMRDHAIRRVPVVEDRKPIGILSLGDIAQERDPSSVLADVSEAPANN